MRNRILILVAVLAGAAIGALYGGVFRDRTSAASAALAGAQANEDFKAGFSLNASTASLIADLQSHLRVSPKDEHSYTLLGLAYQQRARETGDPTWYTKLRRRAAPRASPSTRRTTSPSAGSARWRSPATASATPSRSASRRASSTPTRPGRSA